MLDIMKTTVMHRRNIFKLHQVTATISLSRAQILVTMTNRTSVFCAHTPLFFYQDVRYINNSCTRRRRCVAESFFRGSIIKGSRMWVNAIANNTAGLLLESGVQRSAS